jgi:sortase (surface protein transpeptidase)
MRAFRSREVTLYDSAIGQPRLDRRPPRPPRPKQRPRHTRRSLLVAVLAPAVIAGLSGFLLAPTPGHGDGAGFAPSSASAAELASWSDHPLDPSDLKPLVPIVQRGGHAQLASYSLASATVRPARPVRIAIPDAGVSSVVDAVGANSRGLEVPGLGRTGWWRGGPRPGEAGRAVIVGHLDSKKGPDVFGRVPSLRRGDPISVADARGDHHLYVVVGSTRVRKARFPTKAVYGPSANPVLVLITCGGPYDAKRGHYRDNVLVYARATAA